MMKIAVEVKLCAPSQFKEPISARDRHPGFAVFEGETLEEIRDSIVSQIDVLLAALKEDNSLGPVPEGTSTVDEASATSANPVQTAAEDADSPVY